MLNTFKSRGGVALVVILSVCASTGSAQAADKTFRRTEQISGLFYDVQYTLKDDGSVDVRPISMFDGRRWYNVPAGDLTVDPKTASSRTAVSINGKTYSVAFDLKNGRVSGTVYAHMDNGKWSYSSPSAAASTAAPATAKPAEPVTQAPVQPKAPVAVIPSAPATPKPKASGKRPVVAEFKIYENAVRPFGLTAHESKRFMEDGHYSYPDVNFTVSPHITDSNNSLGIGADININGTTSVGAGARILGRYTGADVTSHVNGNFHRDFYASENGIAAGPFVNEGIQTSAAISAKTEFRLLRRFALRKAKEEAQKQIAKRTPVKLKKLEASLAKATDKAVAESNTNFHDTVRKLSDIKPETKDIPFTPVLSSKASTRGSRGHMSVALTESGEERETAPPTFDQAPQMATSFVLHEDAINKSVTPLLAGKKIKLGEAFNLVCSNELLKRLSFCKKLDPGAAGKVVTFDSDRPFHISFLDGEMKIELNAVHEVEGVAVKATPYSIEATYSITSDGMQRKALTVRERGGDKEKPSAAKGDHSIAGLFNRAVRFVADPVEKAAINDAYSKAFKEEVEFPSFEVPLKLHSENPKSNPTPTVTKRGTFVPLETKSAKGWFATASALCTDDMGAIGINFQNRKTKQGYELVITSVIPGSPAALLDIKVGDRIASYKAVGEENSTPVASEYAVFTKRVAELAKGDDTDARRMILVGMDSKGVAFNKTIALCPKEPKSVSR